MSTSSTRSGRLRPLSSIQFAPARTRPSTRPPIHSTPSAAGHSAFVWSAGCTLDTMIFFQKSLFVIKFFLR